MNSQSKTNKVLKHKMLAEHSLLLEKALRVLKVTEESTFLSIQSALENQILTKINYLLLDILTLLTVLTLLLTLRMKTR